MGSNVAMSTVVRIQGVILGTLAGLLFGCSSPQVETPRAPDPARSGRATVPASAVDESLGTEEYQRLGMPDPRRVWSAGDYATCRDVLNQLELTNRAALPRMGSPRSGVVFARLINRTNTLSLGERFLPAPERIRLFITLLNRFSAFQDIYRQGTQEPVFHRESIEIQHAYLGMLRSAVEWDGKILPPGPDERQGETFSIVEASYMGPRRWPYGPPEQGVVPRGDRFVFVGTYTALTMRSLLQWLADGGGMPDAERRLAIAYVKEAAPVLWPHVKASQQRELVALLNEVRSRTSHGDIQRELEELRSLLVLQ